MNKPKTKDQKPKKVEERKRRGKKRLNVYRALAEASEDKWVCEERPLDAWQS